MLKKFFTIYLLVFIFQSVLNLVVIPFKTHHSKKMIENEEDFNSDDLVDYYYRNKIYFPIEIGSPPKEVAFILATKTSGLNIGYSICPLYDFSDLPKKFFEYSSDNSTTYNLTSSNMKTISNTLSGSPSTELFKFYSNLDRKELKVNDLPFIYTSEKDANELYNDGTICGIIGLALFEFDTFNERYHLISMLKKRGIINNYIFNYEFDKNNDDEGFLVIGEQPHIYNSQYNEEQLKNDYAVAEHFDLEWSVMFNSIYFFDKDNNKIMMNNIKYGQFIPEIYCIKGTSEYRRLIEENFFNYYINKSICRSERNKYYYYIISCDIDSEFKKENFPSLFFVNKKFNYTFELDYNDLFIKKGNKYFFLVIFPSSYIEHFELGKIFLKKYFFFYDIDKKTINFYNKNIPITQKNESNENNENNEKNGKEKVSEMNFNYRYLIISVGIIILVFSCFIGFYFGYKMYKKARNKRKNEVEDECEYSLNH